MSSLSKLTADQARAAYQKLRLSTPTAELEKPELHPDNQLLPDTPDDVTDQLSKTMQGRPLKVLINEFTINGQDGDNVSARLRWNGVATGLSVRFQLPVPAGTFPIELATDQRDTVNPGRFDLSYVVTVVANPQESEKQSINIDTMPPNGNAPGDPVILPPQVEANGITKEYLDDNNGVVAITIPEYGDAKINDVINVRYGEHISGSVIFASVTRANTTDPIIVDLTEAHIGTSEGTRSIFYTLTDRVGNVGPYSAFKNLEVTLTPAPANLVPPKVPQADDITGIDYQDAVEGVGVQIDAYDHHVTGSDKVIVVWDNIAQNPVDIAGFPTFITVPFRDVKAADDGPKNIHVSYSIVRGNRSHPEPTGKNVDVDIRKPGPDNPDDPPGPVNPALELVTVQGGTTPTPNTLLPADRNQDATASVQIYDNSKNGDVMQLYWKGVAVPAPEGVYEVDGTEPPNFMVSFKILWPIIDAAGNDSALPVHYTIKNPAINDNEDASEPQPVSVSVNPVTVPDPTFQNLYHDEDLDKYYINCNALVNDPVVGWSVAVRVPGGEPRLAGQELLFKYQGWEDEAGSIIKDDTDYEVKFTPTTEQANNGFIIYVPYDPPILTTRIDSGSIEYTAVLNGFPVPSNRHLVRVHVEVPGGDTCPLQ